MTKKTTFNLVQAALAAAANLFRLSVVMTASVLLAPDAFAVSLYAQDSLGNQLYLVDTDNLGSPQLIGAFSGFGPLGDIAMLATASATELYMVDRADGRLLTVDRTTAAIVSAVTLDVAIPVQPRGLDLSPDGILYAVTVQGSLELRTVNPATGVTTIVAPIGIYGIEAIAFAPDGTLYAAGSPTSRQVSDYLYRINPVTGALTTIARMGIVDIDALAFGTDGFLYGADSDVNAADLYRINPASGALTNLGSTGVYGLNGLAVNLPAVPIPAAAWLFGSALGVMGWMRRKSA